MTWTWRIMHGGGFGYGDPIGQVVLERNNTIVCGFAYNTVENDVVDRLRKLSQYHGIVGKDRDTLQDVLRLLEKNVVNNAELAEKMCNALNTAGV